MHGSHLAATLRASAINSLVLRSSTPVAVAARPRSLKLFMTSGVLDFNVARPVETDCVSSRKWVRSDMSFSKIMKHDLPVAHNQSDSDQRSCRAVSDRRCP